MTNKKLSFWQLLNMTFGFFGIQFGWTLQMGNMSAIYEYLGANPEQIPILWLAAPVSGLIVQPIIGYMSDRTWTPLGRRRPYFLVGAILSSIALVLMPNSSALWMAAGLLWILDCSINVSTEPFRTFLADVLPEKQRTQGFAMQSFFVGLGAVVAGLLPWCLNNVFGVSRATENSSIPLTVKLSFYLGAAVFLGAVIWTVVFSEEHPPEDLAAQKQLQAKSRGLVAGLREFFKLIEQMPETMKQLAWVQFFTWLGMFCFFLYFPVAVAHNIFGAVEESSPLYTDGIEWAGICMALYSCVCIVFSLFLSKIAAASSRKITHSFCLFSGGAGLVSLLFIRDQYLMLLSIACFGIAWSSIIAMPYSIVSGSLPANNRGIYMGIFNAFIVIPQIIAALGLGWVMRNLLNNNSLLAVVLGGCFFIVASILIHFVNDVAEVKDKEAKALNTQLAES